MIYQLPDMGISFAQKKLHSALHLTGTQATRANIDTLDLAVNYSANTLNVRLPLTFRLQMGVADVVAAHLTFCTDFANTCHAIHLLNRGLFKNSCPTRNGDILTQAAITCK